MASSDDEVEDLPESVSDYHFVDENEEPISFSDFPFQWNLDQILGGKRKVFVRGTFDDGLRSFYKQVTAWKFDLSRMNPEILVRTKDSHWIKLQKPKKSFEGIIRATLITVHCLHLLKKNPEMPDKLLWNQLSKSKNLSLLEPKASVNDLIDHVELIEEASRRDLSLSKSKFIATFLEERPQKMKFVEEDGPERSMKGFIVDDVAALDDDDDDDDDDEDQLFDSVCAICDNGGRITLCEGICIRSFHRTEEDANKDAEEDGIDEVSICSSLGYSKKEIWDTAPFTCKNCMHNQHQCFSCGLLGSSDTSSGAAEVFKCESGTCGYFYHPRCVAKLCHPDDEVAADHEVAKIFAAGGLFTCPIHTCDVCKELETVDPLQFAVCRRCPTSYHRKCLPRDIPFEDTEGFEQRAWENLLHINNRILIYCSKHEIDPDLGTPIRNHLKFPGEACQKQEPSSALILKKKKLESEKRSLLSEMKKLKQAVPDASIRKLSHLVQEGRVNEKIARRSLVPSKRKFDGTDASSIQPVKKVIVKKKTAGSSLGENRVSLGEQLWEKRYKQSESANQRKVSSEDESHKAVETVPEESVISEDKLHPDSKKRIEYLFREAESSITLQSIYNKYKTTRTHSQKDVLDKFSQGRVEGLVKSIKAALQKLDDGCSIKEAEAVCGPNVLNQIVRYKNKLRVYLAPFIHHVRYTSFGRHFTKVDKLKEIVDKIHWYVEDDDTVVDFCCGANDFSSLMKDKLEQRGKKCSYRNFDLFKPKNDFCFERRDWNDVKPHELPKGSKLVMGLNPPFGVNASLANKFINKALEFKPKLLILIVPQETERLDKKKPPYDLVWEDFEKLSGKSFYLPGSINNNDKQMEDWNVVAPVLFLWCRRDFTSKCRAIAEKHGHISEKPCLVERNVKTVVHNEPIEANAQASDMEIDSDPQLSAQEKKHKEIIKEEANIKRSVEESSHHTANKEGDVIICGGSAEQRKKNRGEFNNRRWKKQQKKWNKYVARKDVRYLVGENHQMHENERPPPGKPYYIKPEQSPANDTVFSRSPQMVQSLERPNSIPPGKPYYIKPDHSPANDAVFSRSPQMVQSLERPTSIPPTGGSISCKQETVTVFPPDDPFLVNKKLSSSGGSTVTGIDHTEEPGFPGPGYQHRPQYHPGPPHYPEDNFPGRYGIDHENTHMRGQYGMHPLDQSQDYMREGFSQRPYNTEMGSRYSMPPPPSLGAVQPPPYGNVGMSAMDRYAPKLDQCNYPIMGNVGPPDPLMPGHGGMYNYQEPTPPYVPMGFAPGPRTPYANQSSGGWLNDEYIE